jgi:hypothetical protein
MNESFRLVQEGVTWMNSPDTLVHVSVTVLPREWGAQVVGSSLPSVVTETSVTTCWVDFKNTGTRTWDPSLTRLGTQDPQDHASSLYTSGSTWLGPNRACCVGTAVAPGAVGRFTFTITAPVAPQTFGMTESFRLVEEGVAWFQTAPTDSLVTLSLTVKHVPKPGDIHIVSDPPGASVFLSGNAEYAGRFVGFAGAAGSPLVVPKLPPLRSFHVRVVLPGRAAFDADPVVPDNAVVDVAATLPVKPLETYLAETPVLAGGQPLLARGGYATPFVVDWDDDGKLDMLVGNGDGTVDLYAGGNAQKLELGTPQPLGTSAGPIAVGKRATPFVVDWNADDKKDLLVGAADGKVYLFLNGGTDAAPALAAPVALEAGGVDFVAPGGNAAPWVVDWDGDGKKDVLVGAGDGEVLVLLNVGSDAAPSFGAPEQVMLQQKGPLNVLADAAAIAADWNNDGLFDLVVGAQSGDAIAVQNLGASGTPRFKATCLVRLFANGGSRPFDAIGARLALVDVDGDGLRDLVVGDATGAVSVAAGGHLDGDVDGSGAIDARDLARVARAIGSKRGDARYAPALDLNGDGVIDASDLAIVTKSFGRTY